MGSIEIKAKCPRCGTKFKATAEANTHVLCPGCGARLQYRQAAPAGPIGSAAKPPDMTQELSAAVVAAKMERGRREAQAPAMAPPQSRPAPPPPQPTRTATANNQPGAVSSTPTAPPPERKMGSVPSSQSSIEELMFALYQTQKQILEVLQQRLTPNRPARKEPLETENTNEDQDFSAFPPAATRSKVRKSVLLIDDDDASRAAAVAALEKAEVPVRTAADGHAAIQALTLETPDVIALEGEMSGEVSGKDVVDRVRSVMEWVNIPILLYTQSGLESQDEARVVYGADGYVLKGPNGPDALVSQVIALFRRS